MRHNNNQQNRRFRGGRNNGNGHNNHGHSHNHGNNGQRRVNPRVQTFDSNGPDVRIRGNAIQITEKYMGLARDAAAAGDRVLAESYYQHAEHYQRMLNEAAEEQNRYQAQFQSQQQQQPNVEGEGFVTEGVHPADAPQPVLNDLDQGFLVDRQPSSKAEAIPAAQPSENDLKQPENAPAAPSSSRPRRTFRPKEVESA